MNRGISISFSWCDVQHRRSHNVTRKIRLIRLRLIRPKVKVRGKFLKDQLAPSNPGLTVGVNLFCCTGTEEVHRCPERNVLVF